MGFKRGIPREISRTDTITYTFTKAELIKRLRLPDHAVLSVDGVVLGDRGPDAEIGLNVQYTETR